MHNRIEFKLSHKSIRLIMEAENVGNGIRVLMFPWLAVGHITPFLGLAKKLSQRGFCIHLCSTPINLSFFKNKIPQKYSSSIQLLELHLPELPDLPPHYHTTNGLPLHLHTTLHKALEMAEPTFSDIVGTMKPHLLIYDFLQPWAAAIAKSHNVPAVQFPTSGSAMFSYAFHAFFRQNAEFPFAELSPSIYDQERLDKILAELRSSRNGREDKNMIVIGTSTEIEGNKYLDYMSELAGCKTLTLGTLVQEHDQNEGRFEPLMEWLGKKEEKSTVFVSFGSEYFLSDHDRHEVAIGLEKSRVNFIWVLRFPKNASEMTVKPPKNLLETALPEGFLERVGDRGRVVEGWAPQLRILSHPSIGGFVSHCGWNSVSESIECGVPIIAMPMHLDQPINAKLIVNIGVGVEVVKDDTGNYHSEDVARVCDEVVLGKCSENLQRNVKLMGENVRIKSAKEIGEVSILLAQLCCP
ncbi:unnamed protein product [Cuscuta epithymum]|uniref:Glycosyltransferase n=1 Tax=Cuscuta epithymum TaxID=186058 RepID=A0AAV0CRD3_9ASTE|nr:unnamed protein product [Cuscuta epithymum]